ncbi:MAG TPA: MOSC domain-containing protein [Pseudonocardiaceae bacterium]
MSPRHDSESDDAFRRFAADSAVRLGRLAYLLRGDRHFAEVHLLSRFGGVSAQRGCHDTTGRCRAARVHNTKPWRGRCTYSGVMTGLVAAVSRSGDYTFTKPNEAWITLLTGLGVDGDAHLGTTVRHRSRMARDPQAPNLRQVHLIHAELFGELADDGFAVKPGELGENVTTVGVDLLALPAGTRLHLGANAVIEVTGLRNPCVQIDHFQYGLMKAVLGRDADGNLVRKAGVMSIVLADGEVRPGDAIEVELPARPHQPLGVV